MKTALLIFSGILSFLFPVLCQDSSFPGSGMYMGRECSSPSIVMQYQPDTLNVEVANSYQFNPLVVIPLEWGGHQIFVGN